MPYRIDVSRPPSDALDLLIELGALDIESVGDGLAAILPDSVAQDTVAEAFEGSSLAVSTAVARDNRSVWLLSPRSVRVGGILISPTEAGADSTALQLSDSGAFGTGHHPTTALCLQALEEILSVESVDNILDVGTGSGILALAALKLGVPKAAGLDVDVDALKAAEENARLNHLEGRLRLILGDASVVDGKWALIMANVLAAPLIEMAPVLVRLLAKNGRLILSGIQQSLEPEVRRAYQHFGVRYISSVSRSGWTALILQASW